MKGLLVYTLPKVLKVVGGVAVGIFVFTAFKALYLKYFPMLQDSLNSFQPVVSAGMSSYVDDNTLLRFEWFHFLNFVLPIVETFNTLAIFVPTITTVYLVRFVFRIMDSWINGVISLVSGGK
jgi:hypothetical protein